MPKIPLTIKVDYLPSWGAWEGIRELIQNGRDAEIELSAPLHVDWHNGKLRIENEGCKLPHEALLLGHTTKYGHQELIGKFGEGLKLGILALVRAGHRVKIRSGDEVWDPQIERSATFDADVLVFNIGRGRAERERVRIEIDGISKEDWVAMRPRFLFLERQVSTNEVISTEFGDLLLEPEKRGRVFVKGIFVAYDEKLNYGYNLADADLDRDRRIIHSYDLQSRTRKIWGEALRKRPDLLDVFWSLLEREAPDTQDISQWNADILPSAAREGIAERFAARYGDTAVPVENLEQSKEVEHLGKIGIVAPAPLRAILAEQIGSLDKVLANLRTEIVKTYSWHELDVFERASVENAIRLAKHGAEVELSIVDVVDFRSDLMGQFKDGRIAIARKFLASPRETLATVVHELAHRAGGDGDHKHVAAMEEIWSKIVDALLVELRSHNET